MSKQTVIGDISVELDHEGQGRFTAYLSRPAKGRVRIGTVLGGRRTWVAEPVGKAPTVRGTSRIGVSQRLADWALTQPGGIQLAAN